MHSQLADRTVLVTGGAGFIGSHIADALVDTATVRILDDFSNGARINLPPGVELIEGDVRDDRTVSVAMQDVDVVFHLAAMVSVGESVERPRECHDINTAATLSVLDHARMADARVVFPSSAAIYGHPETLPVSESAPKEPTSPYGISKLAGDLTVQRFASLYDLPTVVLRYFNVYGPRQGTSEYSGVISIFAERAGQGEEIPVAGDGSQTRDFVHIDDVVDATLLAATTDTVGEAFNIGTGERTSIRRLAEEVRDLAGSESTIEHTEPRSGDIQNSCADIEKARRVLGYEPTVSLRDGLAALLEE